MTTTIMTHEISEITIQKKEVNDGPGSPYNSYTINLLNISGNSMQITAFTSDLNVSVETLETGAE